MKKCCFILLFLVYGCITQRYYFKQEVDDATANRDLANCQAKAGQACGQHVRCFHQVEGTCMRGEGYILQTK